MNPDDALPGEKIHTRNIDVSTYSMGEKCIIVEGILRDDRLKPYYRMTGEQHPPHTVHCMAIRMQVSGDDLTITDITARFDSFPQADCPKTAGSLTQLIGWKIAPGFTQKVKNLIGGNTGCAHLTALLMAMAPAAVQGYWSNRSQKPRDENIPVEIMNQFLIDTCWVWRREGPLAQSILAATQPAKQKT
ncbi:MAG: DUF2889 domain-containing protein [Thermodesulfobacteriota bacterium]